MGIRQFKPVTKGTRYATLPFLFDEAGDQIRAANAHTLAKPEPQEAAPAAD